MNSKHPTFPNPIIQEAICEIHFRLPDSVVWDSSLFGELFKHIQSEFPVFEPVTQVGIQFQIGPGGMGQAFLPPQQRMRYKHASRNLLLQLSSNTLTVNVLPKYPGWKMLSKDILNSWRQTRKAIKLESITRIGLRYINLIKRVHANEPPGDWLTPSDFIPMSVLSSLPGFLSRLETRTDVHNRAIVTLGEMTMSADQSHNPIVLDIDCIVEKEIELHNDAITDELERLHDVVWNIFSASMTPRLKQLLQGEI